MKKICFIITSYNGKGGMERVLSQIANELVERNYHISIVSLGKGLNPNFYTDPHIELYELNTLVSKSNHNIFLLVSKTVRKIKKIKNILEQINPDFVVTVGVGFYRYIEYARKKLKPKTIAWEHFCFDAFDEFQIKLSRNLAIKHADKVVVLSNRDLSIYQKKYPCANNIIRIYNPIAFNITNNIDVNNKVVIAAGRYVHEKGFDLLIDAWSKIANESNDWELRIFGEGADREKLQRQIDIYKLSNIKLCGYSDNLDKELEKASIFALSSRFEGLGLVLLEAQSKGLPCISFDCICGPREIINHNVNGFLVLPENTDAFAEKLLVLMKDSNLRQSFSNNSHKDLYRFDTNNIINEWINLFEELS